MEGNMKSSGRGIKGKVVTMYSKYAKAQANSAPSVVTLTQVYKPAYTSSIGAAGGDVDERASAYIRAVRERFKNEQKMA